MSMLFETLYRQAGVRRSSQLLQPPLGIMDHMVLPRRSLFHYMGSSPLDSGPDSNQIEFRGVTKPIVVSHVFQQSASLGNPRAIPTSTQLLASQWFQRHRRYKKLLNFDTGTRDETTLAVMNYAFLWRTYRYPRSLFSGVNQWHNIAETMWAHVADIAVNSNRHQFIPVTLPKILPCLADLKIGEQGQLSQRLVKRFNSHEALMILEIWKWLGENRKSSMLSHVPDDRLARVNLLMEESGRWFIVNLGTLDGWRSATKEELEANPKANQHGFEPHRIQRYFLRMLMSLMEVRTAAAPEVMVESDTATAPNTETPDEPTNIVESLDPVTGAVVKTVSQPLEVPTALGITPKQIDADIDEDLDQDRVKVQRVASDLQQADDAPDERGADIEHDAEMEKQVDADLEMLEHIANLSDPDEDKPIDDTGWNPVTVTPESAVMKIADRLAEQGMLSAGEHRRYQALSQAYKKIVAPDGKSTLGDFAVVTPEDVSIPASPTIPDIATVTDKTMLKSSLLVFDEQYIDKVMQKDVASMVLNLQQAGLCVTSYDVEQIDDVTGSFNIHTVRVTPIEGAASTFRFRLPVLNKDGTFTANSVKYRLRKQRGDKPIRKIGPDRVSLTSYYGKVFVSRSTKRVNDYGQWLTNSIMSLGLDRSNGKLGHMHTASVFDNLFKEAPRLYSTLAMSFRGFTLGGFEWNFDHTKREVLYGADTLKMIEHNGMVLCGKSQTDPNAFLIMDPQGALYQYDKNQRHRPTQLPSIEEMLGLDAEKAPVDFAEVKVLGRTIPLGIMLGYELGLERLLRLLKVEPRRVPAGQRVNLQPNEYSIVFADETLVFLRENAFASMVLAGFNEFHRSLRTFNVHEFDRRGVYLNVLESGGASQRYLREVDLQYQLFIDPITRELLIEMKEPTDYQSLLLKACDLLLTDHHPDELDSEFMRIKGYERMAGAVYSEIVRSIRAHNGRVGKSRVPIDLNPFQVWKNITQDPAKIQVSEINPIQNLKEIESVTYAGVGGRGGRSMTKGTRSYHRNDMGTISESTVDSSDVAINTYTSADPQFTSLRGLSRPYDMEKGDPTSLLSTSALLAPAADRDDPKRVNFIGIQQSHGVACKGYRQAALRTGYEQVIAHRTGDLFAQTAKKPGKVLSVSEHGIQVRYDDGEVQGIELGRRFGNAAGLILPHQVNSPMRPGQAFKVGDLISYNEGFFEPDVLNPSSVVWKAGLTVKTVFMEAMVTLEDSSAISKEVAELLTTRSTKVRTIVVNFDQEVHKLLNTGANVGSEDILCVIEDAVTAGNRLFDEASLDTLRVLSAQTPQAKAKGVIERIDVFYHGDLEDMSPTLQKIAAHSDVAMMTRSRAVGKKGFTGSVDESFRVDGVPLQSDTAAIQIYITGDVAAGVGD